MKPESTNIAAIVYPFFSEQLPYRLRVKSHRQVQILHISYAFALDISLRFCFADVFPVLVRTLGWTMSGLIDILEPLRRAAIRALRRIVCDVAWPLPSCASCAASWFIVLPGPGCVSVVFGDVALADLRS